MWLARGPFANCLRDWRNSPNRIVTHLLIGDRFRLPPPQPCSTKPGLVIRYFSLCLLSDTLHRCLETQLSRRLGAVLRIAVPRMLCSHGGGPASLREADDSKRNHVCLVLPSHRLYTIETAVLYTNTQAAIRWLKRSALFRRTSRLTDLSFSASVLTICPQ